MDDLPSAQSNGAERSAAEQSSATGRRLPTAEDYAALEEIWRQRETRWRWQIIGGLSGALVLSFAEMLVSVPHGWYYRSDGLVFLIGWGLGSAAGRRIHRHLRGPVTDSVLAMMQERGLLGPADRTAV